MCIQLLDPLMFAQKCSVKRANEFCIQHIIHNSSEEFNDKEVKGLGFIDGKVKLLVINQL